MAIPIDQVKIDGAARFVIAQSKQDLEKAPAFDAAKMKWPIGYIDANRGSSAARPTSRPRSLTWRFI